MLLWSGSILNACLDLTYGLWLTTYLSLVAFPLWHQHACSCYSNMKTSLLTMAVVEVCILLLLLAKPSIQALFLSDNQLLVQEILERACFDSSLHAYLLYWLRPMWCKHISQAQLRLQNPKFHSRNVNELLCNHA